MAGPSRWYPRLALTCVFAAFSVVMSVPATADPLPPGGLVVMEDVCEHQYPETPDFHAGVAYLVAPSDAYSWRCKRSSVLAIGGTIADLPVDPRLGCTTGRAKPIGGSSPDWVCE